MLHEVSETRRIYKMSVRHGDLSAEEAMRYASKLREAPQRSMIGWEGDRRANGALLEFDGLLNWQPTLRAGDALAPILDPRPNAWCVLAQYNSVPPDDKWKSPPLAIGAKNIGGVEHLIAELNVTVDGASRCIPLAAVPMARRVHKIRGQFRNMAGKPGGRARLWVNDKLVADHEGLTGHEGHLWSHHAFGLYRWCWSPPENTIDAWFENWDERVLEAPTA